jgi:exo-beta-1,3-glucanase (GH17 family)
LFSDNNIISNSEKKIANNSKTNNNKFQGLCYGPYRDNENPNNDVQPSIDEITSDMSLLKNLTTAIRTYGVTDNLEQIPLLCQQNGIDCYPGAWISTDLCENDRQIDSLIKIAGLNLSHVKGLIVGSEVMLRNDVTEQQLIGYINNVKSRTSLTVAAAEVWSTWLEHPNLANAVDVIYVHIYPYWDGISIDSASSYLIEKWNEIKSAYPDKKVVIGETGWPSDGNLNGNALPSAENQEKYLSDFISVVAQNNIDYFYFEVFDEKWKVESTYQIGDHWGIYNSDGSIKNNLIDLVPEVAAGGLSRVTRNIDTLLTNLPLYVYHDGCDPQNAFCPSGWMGELATIFQNDSTYKDPTQIIDVSCTDNPDSGSSCIRISYKPSVNQWGGIYWQFPINNWGQYPGYKIDKNKKVIFEFYARGANGGEQGEFKTGGIHDITLPYFDSYQIQTTGVITLDNKWKKYTFDLTGQDLGNIIGGFCWVTNDIQNPNGCTIYLDEIAFRDANVTNIVTKQPIPYIFSLEQNYPNPFNPTSTIKYQIPISGLVKLTVFDILGRKVADLINEDKSPGIYEVKFDGSNLSSGIYFYKLTIGAYSQTKKLVLIK